MMMMMTTMLMMMMTTMMMMINNLQIRTSAALITKAFTFCFVLYQPSIKTTYKAGLQSDTAKIA